MERLAKISDINKIHFEIRWQNCNYFCNSCKDKDSALSNLLNEFSDSSFFLLSFVYFIKSNSKTFKKIFIYGIVITHEIYVK